MILSKAILVGLVGRLEKADDCRTCYGTSSLEVCMSCGRFICSKCDTRGPCGNGFSVAGCADGGEGIRAASKQSP